MNRKTIRKSVVILILLIMGSAVSLVAHSRLASDSDTRVPVFSEENVRGTLKWWIIGAPFYLFLIFAPDRFFLDEDEDFDN
jgi:hypothetical protein